MRGAVPFLILTAALALAALASLAIGARAVPLTEILTALTTYDPMSPDHAVLRDLRLPRLWAALLAGAALGVSGAIMQILTRNPLADPGILGVNSGAALAVVGAAWLFDVSAPAHQVWAALPGAALVALLVYALGTLGRRGASPVRLTLAGAAFSKLTLSLVSAIILTHQEALETYRFWIVGSLAGVRPLALWSIGPVIGLGLALAALAARGLNALILGDDTARALGIPLGRLRLICFGAVTLSCGAAVALTGPIGFVGLVVPHVARVLVGGAAHRIMAASALIGPLILLIGDTCGRVVLPNGELPVGIATVLIGGPLFVLIVRRMERQPR